MSLKLLLYANRRLYILASSSRRYILPQVVDPAFCPVLPSLMLSRSRSLCPKNLRQAQHTYVSKSITQYWKYVLIQRREGCKIPNTITVRTRERIWLGVTELILHDFFSRKNYAEYTYIFDLYSLLLGSLVDDIYHTHTHTQKIKYLFLVLDSEVLSVLILCHDT